MNRKPVTGNWEPVPGNWQPVTGTRQLFSTFAHFSGCGMLYIFLQ
jgi:hypothetical protein